MEKNHLKTDRFFYIENLIESQKFVSSQILKNKCGRLIGFNLAAMEIEL